ncbi:hypothetical protein [Tsukamurella pseudospumae]|uniref:Uncharacterized protein n=1 Tax=Tsukamurella pseudospumae TaxID=239498 RepID=A0A138AX27_9ACTN|nr:hypothetical protein [Tsukamurella pseudospumae]KXP14916.1 hypothetical protein AXK60_03340 [Tsukamurella pseudospumae]
MRAHLFPGEADQWGNAMTDAYDALERGIQPADVAAKLTRAGIDVDPGWLTSRFGAVSPSEAAVAAYVEARSADIARLDPTRDELADMVRRIISADALSEWWVAVLSAHVPHPAPIDLIFHPAAGTPANEMTPEAIVDRALAHRPIEL